MNVLSSFGICAHLIGEKMFCAAFNFFIKIFLLIDFRERACTHERSGKGNGGGREHQADSVLNRKPNSRLDPTTLRS